MGCIRTVKVRCADWCMVGCIRTVKVRCAECGGVYSYR